MWFPLVFLACQKLPDLESGPIAPYDPIPLVDPLIGTGGQGFEVGSINPGPLRPWGLVKAGPDTASTAGSVEFLHCAGYHADDEYVTAFTHVHAHGMGVGDYGMFPIMPRDGFTSAFTADGSGKALMANEEASPGYYAVDVDGIRAESTATEHAAMHRFSYPTGANPVVVVDLGHTIASNEVLAANWVWDPATNTLSAFQQMGGSYSNRYGGLLGHMVVQFDPPPVSVDGWSDPAVLDKGLTEGSGIHSGVSLTFSDDVVTARVGISFVDAAGALANLNAEIPANTAFDALHEESVQAWREELGSTRVRGGTAAEQTMFHTALYHAYAMPTLFSDVDGRYRGLDGEVHEANFPYYTDFSLWDTFRTLHPWLILAKPERQAYFNQSLVRQLADGGSFDRWPLGHGYTGGMVGSPTDQVLAESWQKGMTDFDVDAAWQASWLHATTPVSPVGRDGITGYVERGYVAWEDSNSPAALTLEYAWSDDALARWGAALGHDTEATQLAEQAHSWQRTFDADRGFFVGRYADGTYSATFDPDSWADDYVEGAAWQYLWMVPYDVPGMIDVQHGGDTEAFLTRLDGFWAETYAAPDTAFPDPYYWHGNEPDIHYGYLASLAGHPDKSAAPIRWILSHRYATEPSGLDGNDDAGTLSAWYLWSAIGVFPVAGTDEYALGAPLFDRTEIDRGDGTTWTIVANGASETGMYVHEAAIGGTAIGSVFTHGAWADAQQLDMALGADPVGFGAGAP